MKKLFIFLTALFITSLNADSSNIPLNNLISLEKEKIIAGIDTKDIYDICDDSDKIRLFYEAYMNSYDNSDPLIPSAELWKMDKFDHYENKETLSNIRKYKYALITFDTPDFNADDYNFEKKEFKYPIAPNELVLSFMHAFSSVRLQVVINGSVSIKADIPSAKILCTPNCCAKIFALVEIKKAGFGGPDGTARILNTNIVKYFALDRRDDSIFQSSEK